MIIELRFEMPFYLGVEGFFPAKVGNEIAEVTLSTFYEKNPRMPGASFTKNIVLADDDTNIFRHTKVMADIYSDNPHFNAPENIEPQEIVKLAMSLANILITGVRLAYNDYIKEFIHSPKKLGPIDYKLKKKDGSILLSGNFDSFMGGITFATPPKKGIETIDFARILKNGAEMPIAKELYYDARRYMVNGNARMAMANLLLSFEVGLADSLYEIASCGTDTTSNNSILNAPIGTLGSRHSKRLLGASLNKSQYWGDRFANMYLWLKKTRDSVLHKANLIVEVNGKQRDFSDIETIKSFFEEYDWMQTELERAVRNIISNNNHRN